MKRVIWKISALILIFSLLFNGCVRIDKEQMKLSNPNSSEMAKRVYKYICDIYCDHIITGQQESTWMGTPDYEMDYIFDATGKYPAIRGLDFMNDDFDGVVERSVEWWEKGGLVSICWHCGPDFSGNYDNCKEDEIQNWDAVLTEGTPENEAFIKNMDNAGNALLELQKMGVVVLWRPFHEFDGDWFWWSKGGSDNFKKLWVLMYNHFTYDLGLNNLIWVLGYSHNGKDYDGIPADWYPGDEYCDIIGADTYEVEENGAEKRLYKVVAPIADGRKPLIMHECGKIPTIEQFQKVKWGAFLTWHTEWLIDNNTKDELKAVYTSEYAITLDELNY